MSPAERHVAPGDTPSSLERAPGASTFSTWGLLQERADSVGICNTAWPEAMKRAELTDLRFHDLRHTWASWHRQAGTSSLSPELAARFLVRQAFREARI